MTWDSVDFLRHSLQPGPSDSVCDVPGVRVGQVTLHDGPDVHTGVTAIVPDPLPTPSRPLPCGFDVANGHGKFVGSTQVEELGTLETPIVLTNTFATFLAADALLGWMLEQPGMEQVTTLNPVVGECNDSSLSDIRSRPVTAAHVRAALDGATDTVCQGAVGAGAGTRALGFKGGIGSASRRVGDHTVGVITQTNFSGLLTVAGRTIAPDDDREPPGNSCVIVVATDAPLDARQLRRVARRAVLSMGRVGADYHHGSGDYAIAFSTATTPDQRPDSKLNPVFDATTEATTAALVSSLWHAETVAGFEGRTARGLQEVLRERGEGC